MCLCMGVCVFETTQCVCVCSACLRETQCVLERACG